MGTHQDSPSTGKQDQYTSLLHNHEDNHKCYVWVLTLDQFSSFIANVGSMNKDIKVMWRSAKTFMSVARFQGFRHYII